MSTLSIIVTHRRPTNNRIRFFLFLSDTIHRRISLFLLIIDILIFIFIHRWSYDGKLHPIILCSLKRTMCNKLIIIKSLIFRPYIHNLDLWTRNRCMFSILLTINIQPFCVVRVLHLLLCHFSWLVIIKRMWIFVPCASIYL